MGIQNLLPFLGKYAHKVNLNDLRAKVCGIEVFGWLYKGAYSCAYELDIGETTTKHVEYVVLCVEQLLALQNKPVCIRRNNSRHEVASRGQEKRKSSSILGKRSEVDERGSCAYEVSDFHRPQLCHFPRQGVY